MKRDILQFGTVALAAALLAPSLWADISQRDLSRLGYGRVLTQTVEKSRELEPPPPEVQRAIPPPVLPGFTEEEDLPPPTLGQDRVLSSAYGRPTPPVEGPTAFPRATEARRREGSFQEVEDFFFRPRRVWPRLHTVSSLGLTGLGVMTIAEVPPQGTIAFRAGLNYTPYRKAFGSTLFPGQEIRQFVVPLQYLITPLEGLEIGMEAALISEEGRDFPLFGTYDVAGFDSASIRAKYRFYQNPLQRSSAAFSFGVRSNGKDTVTRIGSNGIDYLASAQLTRRISNWGLHAEGGALFANGTDRTNSGVPDVTFWSLGLDFQPSEAMDVSLEVNGVEWQSFGRQIDVTPGLHYHFMRHLVFDVSVPISMKSSVPQGYRYKVLAGLQLRI